MRRILAAAMATLMVLVAGCASTPSATTPKESAPPAGQQPAAKPAAEVKIGVVVPLTGAMAPLGTTVRNGHALALEVWNEKGGFKSLGGAKAVHIYADAQSDVQTARAETERLILREKVTVLTGSYASNLSYGATEIAEKHKVPFVVDTAVADDITERGFKYVFRVASTAGGFGQTTFTFTKEVLKPKSIGLVFENTLYGTSVSKRIRQLAKESGIPVVMDEAYEAKSVDMSPIVSKIKTTKPEVLLVTQYIADAVLLARQMAEQGAYVKAVVGNGGGHTIPDFIKSGGKNADLFYSVSAWNYDMKRPGVKEFTERFREKYGADPDQLAAQAYDTSMVVMNAIEAAASTDPEKIAAALRKTDLETLEGRIRFNEKGQNPATNIIIQVQNGKFVTVWPDAVKAQPHVYPMPPR